MKNLAEKNECSPFTLKLFANAFYTSMEYPNFKKESNAQQPDPLKKEENILLSEKANSFDEEHNIPSSCFNETNREENEKKAITDVAISQAEIDDKISNKKKFFSSDSDISDESGSSICSTFNKTEKRQKKLTVKEKVINIKGDEKREREDENLNGLLRLANKSLLLNIEKKENAEKADGGPSEKKETDGKNVSKVQEDPLNFIENEVSRGENSESTEIDLQFEEEKENFEERINCAVKDAFLLSSSGEVSEENEKEDKEKEKTQKNKRKKKRNSGDHVQGDLQEVDGEGEGQSPKERDFLDRFTVPRISSDQWVDSNEEADEDYLEEIDYLSSSESDNSRKTKSKKKKILYEELSISESSDSDIQQILVKSKDSPVKGRRNINKILKKESLEVETKQARKMEAERKKRVNERQKLLRKFVDAEDQSKLVLDFDVNTQKELVVVDKDLCEKLKPHQRDGVKFMWNSCFESLDRLEKDGGSGCILAHCMGLGKTLQVITLIHTLLTHDTGVKTVLIICPLNTVKNWLKEFKIWLTQCEYRAKPFEILSCKTKRERLNKLKTWFNRGGVLVISYELFRSLTKEARPDQVLFLPALSDPGPDLVICDEGHLLKNMKTTLSQCISRIKTARRIVLTGTPLQNNLLEYYCMVQFVKPNILGTKKEFMNRFVNPIKNGQFEDSTKMDVQLMKRRAHVLHSLLDGFIQRYGYDVLTNLLPEKQEYVISIRLTETQDVLYRMFVEKCLKKSNGLLQDYHWLQKIWTHPLVMMKAATDFDSEKHGDSDRLLERWEKFVKPEEYNDLHGSGKLVLLFKILKSCRQKGDKILVFSQYLSTLNLIEYFLKMADRHYNKNADNWPFADSWVFGEDYFRMDGSTSSEKRFEYCKKFNDPQEIRSRLFLVSTRAGGMGINLYGANRVVVFDVSWNPSHDVQSIFRVYRFGQVKSCYIYRFLAEATMEEKIYQRQVTKLSLAHRIVDEYQIERHYSMMNLNELYSYNPTPKHLWKIPNVPKDDLFAEILASSRDIVVGYHEHDSLLENKEEEELTEEERQAAWADYEKERFQPLSVPITEHSYTLINHEALHHVNVYKKGLAKLSENCSLVLDEGQDQMCKIVDVRTLTGEPSQADDPGIFPPEKNVDSIIPDSVSVPMSGQNFNHQFANQILPCSFPVYNSPMQNVP